MNHLPSSLSATCVGQGPSRRVLLSRVRHQEVGQHFWRCLYSDVFVRWDFRQMSSAPNFLHNDSCKLSCVQMDYAQRLAWWQIFAVATQAEMSPAWGPAKFEATNPKGKKDAMDDCNLWLVHLVWALELSGKGLHEGCSQPHTSSTGQQPAAS